MATSHRRRTVLLCTLLGVGLAATSAFAHGKHNSRNDNRHDSQTIRISDGVVRGYKEDGVYRFLGIPFAAPPVGDLRWRPPAPAKRWSGVRDATEYANTCPQVTELGAFAGPTSVSEDCLYLNVFTTSAKGKKKPVIVWIHGGGNVDGESNDYDGSKLATGGPSGTETVVVTINYRLGLFGFMSNPALNNEGHLWGNYGILDQQAALRWVRRNIRAFGGDPNNVTLGGQSAGARNTTANLMSPFARGLFQRAILQSYPELNWITAEQVLTRGTDFGVAAGCPGSDHAAAACLRKLSVERILQLQGTPNGNGPYTQQVFPDGTVVPLQPGDAWSSGQFTKMPIMTGLVRDENNFGLGIGEYFSGPPQAAVTPEQYPSRVSADVLAEYPLSDYGNNPQLALDRVGSDRIACTALHVMQLVAPQVPTYGYEFVYQNAPYYFPQMPDFQPLAAHTIDIQFLFPGYHGGQLGVNLDQSSGQPREIQGAEIPLSNQLVAAWTNFAKTGNPNGYGNAPWPRFTSSSQTLFAQDLSSSPYSAAQFAVDHKCAFWDPSVTN